MNEDQEHLAKLFLQVLPLAGRLFGSQLRKAGHNLAAGHFRLLVLLNERPRNITELATLHGVSPPTMSNTISMLVDRGWASRERDPDDRRRVQIGLTPRGCEVLKDVHRELESKMVAFCSYLSPEECVAFGQGLEALLSVLKRFSSHLPEARAHWHGMHDPIHRADPDDDSDVSPSKENTEDQ